MSRLRLFVLAAAIPFALWMLIPVLSDGAPLSSRIEEKKREIDKDKGRERVLTSTIAGYTDRIDTLQGDITVLQGRQDQIQADLDAKRAELARIQEDLRQERIRLVKLRAKLAAAKDALAERLVEIYKADEPDAVTVILEADGFEDLLTRAEFIDRVGDQDGRIIDRVRSAKAESIEAEADLDRLEERQARVTAEVDRRLREVAAIKGQLVDRRDDFASVRSRKQSVLSDTRTHRHSLEGDLRALEKEQARVLARIQAAQNPSAPPAGPIRQGSGTFIWPVNGTFTSPFGYRWGRLHAGIDIAVPEGTPIRAADSGRVIIAGWTGGYGNYTCISHSGSLSTCYGHQSRIATSVGANVGKGQVIGYSGNTGNSTGPHLHFEVRVNGNPVDPMGYL
ncbi:MAG: peptidoglycan DD-metalloendopeptidase family protein [Solirubrobacteraceae bacterium]|jgi:murein DD-endopeptidase MepM/ murein hydrolase activator NlpD